MAASRILGKRTQRPQGVLRPPGPEERAWVEHMGRYRSRVPKGIFRYRSHEEANADWERWHVDQMVDPLPSVSGIPFDELAGHIVNLPIAGRDVPVLDLEGLLKTKQGIRPKDQGDAALLRRAIDKTG